MNEGRVESMEGDVFAMGPVLCGNCDEGSMSSAMSIASIASEAASASGETRAAHRSDRRCADEENHAPCVLIEERLPGGM